MRITGIRWISLPKEQPLQFGNTHKNNTGLLERKYEYKRSCIPVLVLALIIDSSPLPLPLSVFIQ